MDEPGDVPAALRDVGGYRLARVLGRGGMGTVYEAIDADDRRVALKLLHPAFSADDAARERLRREVATLHRVRGPHVARVLDAEADADEAFVVTELIDGQSLEDSIQEHGPMDAIELAELAEGLAGALASIHSAGVVHRDLKPGNVMLTDDGPVVIDFGISQLADDARLTQTGLVTGTPGYVDPQVLRGDDPGPDGDWWGWAAVLVYSATGRAPFGRGPLEGVLGRVETGRADVAGLPPRVAQVLRRALHPDPERRMSNESVRRALADHAEGREVTSLLDPEDMPDGGPSSGPTGAGWGAGSAGAGAPFAPGRATSPSGLDAHPAVRAWGDEPVGAAAAGAEPRGVAPGERPGTVPGERPPTVPPGSRPPTVHPAGRGPQEELRGTAVMPTHVRQQFPPTGLLPQGQSAEIPGGAGSTGLAGPAGPSGGAGQPGPGGGGGALALPPGAGRPNYPAPVGVQQGPGPLPGPPEPGFGAADGEWPAWAKPARSRPGIVLAWAIAAIAIAGLYPAGTAIAFAAVLLVAGMVGSAGRSLLNRRLRQGPRKSDVPLATLASPLHLVGAALLSLPGLAVGLLAGAIVWGLSAGSLPMATVLPAVMTVVILLAWWTPSSTTAREGVRNLLGVLAPGVRSTWLWILLPLVAAAVALAAIWIGATPPQWGPIQQPPIPEF